MLFLLSASGKAPWPKYSRFSGAEPGESCFWNYCSWKRRPPQMVTQMQQFWRNGTLKHICYIYLSDWRLSLGPLIHFAQWNSFPFDEQIQKWLKETATRILYKALTLHNMHNLANYICSVSGSSKGCQRYLSPSPIFFVFMQFLRTIG